MSVAFVESYDLAPSALKFMARALRRSTRLRAGERVPPIAVRWTGLRFSPGQVQAFHDATGLADEAGLSILFPQVIGFRLQMALLTHAAYPLTIWSALQVRNRLVRHSHLAPDNAFDLETHVAGQRVLEKGLEVDLVTRLTHGDECLWEGRTTFFYRGRFGHADTSHSLAQPPDLTGAGEIAQWHMPTVGGWRFGKLTGDYNGIHTSDWYARRLGFPSAFAHAQRVAAMCQAKLPSMRDVAQTLDLWIKGSVLYGARVTLNGRVDSNSTSFGVSLEGDPRYALLGRWQPGAQSLEP